MSRQGKLWALLFLGAAVVAVLALASGLASVETGAVRNRALLGLQAAEEDGNDAAAAQRSPTLPPEAARNALWLLSGLGLLGFAALLWRMRHLAPPERESSFIRSFIFAIGAVLIALNLDRLGLVLGLNGARDSGGGVIPALTPSTALSVAIGILLLSLIFLAGSALWQRLPRSSPLDQLALQAEEAIDALQAGDDLRHAIVRCYARMCDVLRQEKQIERQQGMTAREFAAALARHGIAAAEVVRLTRLFELVRYGGAHGEQLDAVAEAEAISCLQAIVSAAQRRRSRRPAPQAGGAISRSSGTKQ